MYIFSPKIKIFNVLFVFEDVLLQFFCPVCFWNVHLLFSKLKRSQKCLNFVKESCEFMNNTHKCYISLIAQIKYKTFLSLDALFILYMFCIQQTLRLHGFNIITSVFLQTEKVTQKEHRKCAVLVGTFRCQQLIYLEMARG